MWYVCKHCGKEFRDDSTPLAWTSSSVFPKCPRCGGDSRQRREQ